LKRWQTAIVRRVEQRGFEYCYTAKITKSSDITETDERYDKGSSGLCNQMVAQILYMYNSTPDPIAIF